MAQQPSRVVLGGSSAGLLALGLFFIRVLVADSGDNAYSYLALIGGALIVAAVPFAIGTFVPAGSVQRGLIQAALALLALVGLLSLALLILSLVIIPSQNYPSDTVLISHLVGLMTLLAALGMLAAIYRRR